MEQDIAGQLTARLDNEDCLWLSFPPEEGVNGEGEEEAGDQRKGRQTGTPTSGADVNPLMPTGAFNICCPRDCVSRTANVESTGRH